MTDSQSGGGELETGSSCKSDTVAAAAAAITTAKLVDNNGDYLAKAGAASSSSSEIILDTKPTESTTKSSIDSSSLHPFVHWAQSTTHISLRVDLIQVENLDVAVADCGSALSFSAQGRGAHGLQDYRFSLEFYSKVDKQIDCHSIERYVLILIKKNDQSDWPRLTKQKLKFPWLRVDFDRYHADDSDDSSNADDNNQLQQGKQSYELLRQQLDEARQERELEEEELLSRRRRGGDNSWFYDSLKRNIDKLNPFKMKYDYRKDTVEMRNSKNTARNALDAKKTYLFLYNLVMFIMFLKVYIVLLIKGVSGTVDDDIVQGAAFIIKVLTYTQLLESIHPMLGLVPGGPLMPFTQVVGRLLVNLFLSEEAIRLDSAPYAHYLFVVWSSIEIFRYSFYALRVFKVDLYPLKWCRYTLFIPLYPMGGLCESMVIFSTIKYYEQTGGYSITLPNAANFSFSLPIALRIYTFFLLGPTIYSLMKYMWRQRSKQLKEKVE